MTPDGGVGGAAGDDSTDVTLGRTMDVEHEELVVIGVGDRHGAAGEIGGI